MDMTITLDKDDINILVAQALSDRYGLHIGPDDLRFVLDSDPKVYISDLSLRVHVTAGLIEEVGPDVRHRRARW